MTRALPPDAIDALERSRACARRSGIEDPAQDSLLATVRGLQRELLTQAQRTAAAMQSDAAAMERMCARVRDLEGHLKAVIDECVQGEHRGSRPALCAARAFLLPGVQYAVVESRVPEEPAAVGRRG